MGIKEIFLSFPILKSERLILRQCCLSDVDKFYELASNSELTKTIPWDYHKSKEETLSLVTSMQERYRMGKCYTWAIADISTNDFMGLISVVGVNTKNMQGVIGYWIGVPYWNKGYMTEAVKMVLEFCITILKLNRVRAEHYVINPASGRVMEKAGMKYEGLFRQSCFAKGIYQDCKIYAILRSDFA